MYGEYLATRALAWQSSVARTGAWTRLRAAERDDQRLETLSVLGAAARALVHRSRTGETEVAAEGLLERCIEIGVWDGVVCAVRAAPSSLPALAVLRASGTELRRSSDPIDKTRLRKVRRPIGARHRNTRTAHPREREVMEHVAQGKRNAEIATSLFITLGTVKRHLDSAYRKLGAKNRAEAIARYAEIVNAESVDPRTRSPALRHGLRPPPAATRT